MYKTNLFTYKHCIKVKISLHILNSAEFLVNGEGEKAVKKRETTSTNTIRACDPIYMHGEAHQNYNT